MDLSYGPEYEEFRQEVRSFIDKHRDRAPRGAGQRDQVTLDWQKLLIGQLIIKLRGFIM